MFNIGSIFGDSDLENLTSKIDTISNELLIKPTVFDQDLSTSTAIKELVDILGNRTTEIDSLLGNLSISQGKIDRYNIYDEIYSSTQIIKRIVWTFINNILQRDAVSTDALTTNDQQQNNNKDPFKPICETYSKNFIKHFKIEKQLRDNIIPNMLRYGDFFIEVIDLKSDISTSLPDIQKTIKSSKVVTETLDYIDIRLKNNGNKTSDSKTRDSVFEDIVESLSEILVDVEHEVQDPGSNYIVEQDVVVDKEGFNLNRVLLKYHKPHNIIVLTSSYGSILGYVEVRDKASTEKSLGIGARFANTMKQISSLYSDRGITEDFVIQKLTEHVVKKIIGKTSLSRSDVSNTITDEKEINKKYEELLNSKLGDELFYLVKKLCLENQNNPLTKKLTARFISYDRVVHFCLNPNEFAPNGTSVLDALVYPAKLYLLTQLSNIVMKLSRASVIRKWINMVQFISNNEYFKLCKFRGSS